MWRSGLGRRVRMGLVALVGAVALSVAPASLAAPAVHADSPLRVDIDGPSKVYSWGSYTYVVKVTNWGGRELRNVNVSFHELVNCFSPECGPLNIESATISGNPPWWSCAVDTQTEGSAVDCRGASLGGYSQVIFKVRTTTAWIIPVHRGTFVADAGGNLESTRGPRIEASARLFYEGR